jgi:hypothetical protein
VIVSLTDYVPEARFDGQSWTQIRIEESDNVAGPWTQIDVIDIAPDTDPAHPEPRSFTTQAAQLVEGWYRISFWDIEGSSVSFDPVQNVSVTLEYTPTGSEVAALLRARTKKTGGGELGNWDNSTRPNAQQVEEIIRSATGTVSLMVGDIVPPKIVEEVRAIVAIRAAMLIELSYWPEQINSARSTYQQLKDLYDDAIGTGKTPGTLVVAVRNALKDLTVNVAGPLKANVTFPASKPLRW